MPEATQQSYGELGPDPIPGLKPFTDPHKSHLHKGLFLGLKIILMDHTEAEETLLPSFSLGIYLALT